LPHWTNSTLERSKGGFTLKETELNIRVAFFACLLTGFIGISGCNSDPAPTATEPQAPGQMAKSEQETLEYLIEMLHRKENLKKNAQAARNLGQMGAIAESAIPELRKAIEETKDDKVRSDAEAAIKAIEEAVAASK